jgi:hypothetical protein
MGREIVYCDTCGDRILAEEFERGKAVTTAGKSYCRRCAPAVASPDPPAPSTAPQGRAFEKAGGSPTKTRRASAGQPQGKTRRIPLQRDTRRAVRRSKSLLIIFVAVIASVVLVLVIVLVMGATHR